MSRLRIISSVGLCAVMLVVSCDSETVTGVPANPNPAAFTASPSFFLVGSGETEVSVRGRNFISSSQARLGGVDRPTEVLNDSTLSVTLFAADLASAGSTALTVFNPAPGGGTSGSIAISISYPTATVTAIEPASALVGDQVPELVVRGSGFVPQSIIIIDGTQVPTTAESDTVLRTTQTARLRATAGVTVIRVVNPAPVGVSTSSSIFTRQNHRPRAFSVSPDSVLRGDVPMSVTITGEHFGADVQAFIDGLSRSSTRLSSTQLRVALTASDVAALGPRSVFVTAPTPGGGTSDTLQLRVVVPPPQISRLEPSSATVGRDDLVLSVRGTDFFAGAVVDWNGSPRPTTFVNDSLLTIQLTTSDFAVAGAAQLVVRIPSRGTNSFTATLPILAAGLSLGAPIVVDMANRALVSDPVRNAIYASVPANSPQFPNSVVKIDPLTGTIVDDVFVGSDPDALAIADDGSFLYVGQLGASQVTRINLATFEISGQIPLPSAGYLGATRAEDILVLPGQSQRVAISLRNTCCSPRHEGVALFDTNTRLPLSTQGHTGSNRIVASPDARFIYGYNNETTEFGFRRIAVSDSGLTQVRVQALFGGFGTDIESGGGYAYADDGSVVSLAAFALVGSLGASGPVRPDAVRGRVHMLVAGSEIRTYHYATLEPLGTAAVDGSGLGQLVQWGSDGIALGAGDRIVLLRGSLVGP